MQSTWIFSLKRRLIPEEEALLITALTEKLNQWQAHKITVAYKLSVKYHRFIVVEALNTVSGCCIDSMMKMVFETVAEFNLEITDAGEIFFKSNFDASDKIESLPFREIDRALNDGRLNPDTFIFDHSAAFQGNWSGWEKKLSESWLKRYIPVS